MKPATLLTTLLLTCSTSTSTTLAATLPNSPTITLKRPSRVLQNRAAAAAADPESTLAGAILTLPPLLSTNTSTSNVSATTTTVRGTFRIPRAEPPNSGPTGNNPVGKYGAAFWIGLRPLPAAECSTSNTTTAAAPTTKSLTPILRAGVDIVWDGTLGGQQTPFAWRDFAGSGGDRGGLEGWSALRVSAGDVVRVTLSVQIQQGIEAEAAVVMENFGPTEPELEDGEGVPLQKVEATKALPGWGAAGCAQAAWVVEDFPLPGRPEFPIALANFTSVSFDQAAVQLGDGTVRDVTGAGVEVLDIRLDAQGGRLTRCELLEARGGLTCRRVVGDA